jgi:integrase-like protein
VSADPDGAWVSQQARNLVMDLDDETEIHRMRFLLRDRDAKYCRSFDAVFAAEGMKVVLTPYRSPQANSHVERLIGGLRREILDHVLILHRRHLVDVLREYAAHHNSHRPHRGLGLRRPHDVGRSIPGLGPAAPEAITRREIFRRAAAAENEVYHAGIEMPLLRSGEGELTSMEMASKMGVDLVTLLDQAVFAAYRRQQELVWTEHQVEHIEQVLESAGISLPPGPPPAMTFIDLSGYTRLTEERGDQAAASVAARLSDIVQVSPRRYRGEVVKWVGDGVMFRFRTPGGPSSRRWRSCRKSRRPACRRHTSESPLDP